MCAKVGECLPAFSLNIYFQVFRTVFGFLTCFLDLITIHGMLYSPWSHKVSEMSEHATTHTHMHMYIYVYIPTFQGQHICLGFLFSIKVFKLFDILEESEPCQSFHI